VAAVGLNSRRDGANALKPLRSVFCGLRLLGTKRSETVVIGDQVFTDVLGAKLLGLRTVLTEPIVAHDFPLTRGLRFLERLVYKRRRRRRPSDFSRRRLAREDLRGADAAAHDSGTPADLLTFMTQSWAVPTARATLRGRERFAARRQAIGRQFPGDVLVVPTGHEQVRANDTNYRFRRHRLLLSYGFTNPTRARARSRR